MLINSTTENLHQRLSNGEITFLSMIRSSAIHCSISMYKHSYHHTTVDIHVIFDVKITQPSDFNKSKPNVQYHDVLGNRGRCLVRASANLALISSDGTAVINLTNLKLKMLLISK